MLIVEDEALVALTMEDVLSEAGFEVCGIADRPEAAIALALGTRIDIAVVDVRLAEGDDGIALAAALQEIGSMLILFATGNPAEVHSRARVGHGCMTKPFEAEWLLAAMHAVDGAAPTRHPGRSSGSFEAALSHDHRDPHPFADEHGAGADLVRRRRQALRLCQQGVAGFHRARLEEETVGGMAASNQDRRTAARREL